MKTPGSEEELAEVIGAATSPIRVSGGGTRPVGRPVDGEDLSVSGLSGITLYEPGALTLVAQAGTPVAEIEKALAPEGQMLAFEPMDHRPLLGSQGEPTIGGVVAANVSGPRRIQAGAARDFLLGVRFVDGAGQVIKNGGRVMKNVTGYDLARLLAGSRGTLGVLSEVSLKVLPKPEVQATLVVPGLGPEEAVAVMAKALRSPFEVTGAAFDGEKVFLRVEGMAGSVEYRSGRLRDLLASSGSIEVSDDPAIWTGLRDVQPLADMAYVARCSVRPSNAARVLELLPGHAKSLMDWGGGLIWVGLADEGGAAPLHRALQARCVEIGGHATLFKGSEALRREVPVFQPEAEAITKLSAGLRKRFDPRGILNPGLMG